MPGGGMPSSWRRTADSCQSGTLVTTGITDPSKEPALRNFDLDTSARVFRHSRAMKMQTSLALLVTLILSFDSSRNALAVSPAPDGGYPAGNTAEGQNALLSLTAGAYNTGVGFLSLLSNTKGSFNTAVGAGTLLANVGDPDAQDGVENTAIGAGALLSNSTGLRNTAIGAFALFNNIGWRLGRWEQ
jgi:hypothetical protein